MMMMVAKKTAPNGWKAQLKMFDTVSPKDIPAKARHSAIGSLPIWDDLSFVRQAIDSGEIPNPHELALDLDIESKEVKAVLVHENGKPLRQAKQAIMARIRGWLEKTGMGKHLDLINRGSHIYIVGKSENQ